MLINIRANWSKKVNIQSPNIGNDIVNINTIPIDIECKLGVLHADSKLFTGVDNG